jgi:hypothetical protein
MIRHTGTFRDNQARYIRNDNKRSRDYFIPDQIDTYDPHRYDHLVPPAKKALKFTARAAWFMMKTLVKTAFRIPRLFSKTSSQPQRKKNPSPATAFPAP